MPPFDDPSKTRIGSTAEDRAHILRNALEARQRARELAVICQDLRHRARQTVDASLDIRFCGHDPLEDRTPY